METEAENQQGKAMYHEYMQTEFDPNVSAITLSRVNPSRCVSIIPVGTEDFVAAEDEWTNPRRRRNKKLPMRWVRKTMFEILPLGRTNDNAPGEKFPSMPTIPFLCEHREKLSGATEFTKSDMDVITALVARPVELPENPEAPKSLDAEWD